MERLLKALRLIEAAKARPSQRLLDTIYGPQGKTLRAEVMTILLGSPVGRSHKLSQYGNTRTALMECTDTTGICTAAEDINFETKAAALLAGEVVAS